MSVRKLITKTNRRILVVAIVAIGGAILLVVLHSISKQQPTEQPSNFNTISDTSIGLVFNMSKSFSPIPKAELATLNPGFNYGFKPTDDPNAMCVVSQISLKGSGTITPQELRDGIIKEIKKVHPDVKLDNLATASNPAKFGEGQGVLLEVSYLDAKIKIKRVEVIALSKTIEVIAYCQSASKDNARYYNDFTTFFSSLKILPQP